MSNEEKDPSRPPEAADDSESVATEGHLGAGFAPGLSASVLSAGADDGPSEVVHEHKSWSHHVVEEPDPGSGGRLRRTLRRWFGR